MPNPLEPEHIVEYNKFLRSLDGKHARVLSPPQTLREHVNRTNRSFRQRYSNSNSISPVKTIIPSIKTPSETRHVCIQEPVASLQDLLSIVERYPYDPSVEYDINLRALHQIAPSLRELNAMIGMHHLKSHIVDQLLYFLQGLHKNKNGSGEYLHTVIYGPPGTGKTEVAKLMGDIYRNLGILSKNTFRKVTRSDLVAGYLGQTAIKTKEVIKDCLGGVMFIDEAYSLGNADKNSRDIFSKECVDTLCESLSEHKDNLMVIVAGYENELKDCFFSINQGLDSRFTWRFKTEEYTPEELCAIWMKKVKDIEWSVSDDITPAWFRRHKEAFPFYGRDMELLLSKTKIAHSRRVFGKLNEEKRILSLDDLDRGMKCFTQHDHQKAKREEEERTKRICASMYC